MRSEEQLLQEFNYEFGIHHEDYALLYGGEKQYSIVNVPKGAMILLEDIEIANFFIKKLIELKVPIYSNIKEIPGWGSKKAERPPEINPLLKDIIESFERRIKRK